MINNRCYIKVNCDNLKHNFGLIKKLASGSRVIPVIKADAYGHGAVRVASLLEECGADIFAVAEIGEAMILREGGITCDILILGYTPAEYADKLCDMKIIQTVLDADHAKALSGALTDGRRLSVHLKVDTGMHRIGVDCLRAKETYDKLKDIDNLNICGIFSHFCESDDLASDMTSLQLERFEKITQDIDVTKHISNSAAIITRPDARLDAVRPGVILYGAYPSQDIKDYCKSIGLDFKSAMTLVSHVTQVKTLSAGEGISYNRKYIAKSDRKIAAVSIGYADGFPRILSNKGYAVVGGVTCPIVGNICMDQLMLDITDVPSDVMAGDEVNFWGEGGLDIAV